MAKRGINSAMRANGFLAAGSQVTTIRRAVERRHNSLLPPYLFLYPSIHPSIHLSISSIYLSIYLLICLSFYLSYHLYIYIYICQCHFISCESARFTCSPPPPTTSIHHISPATPGLTPRLDLNVPWNSTLPPATYLLTRRCDSA